VTVSHILSGVVITRGCYVTGKPLLLGGIAGRRQAAGEGVVHTIEAVCKLLGLDISRAKVCVQGFGNVSAMAAKDMYDKGAKIIAIQDISGSIFDTGGLNIEKLLDHAQTARSVAGFNEADSLDLEEFFEVECDCFIPAAACSQIDSARAQRMKAKLLAEGANAPTTPDVDKILEDRGIFFILDILCNAGGVFVSYLEYIQETQHEQKTEVEFEQRLRERMTTYFNNVYAYANSHEQNMRQAAMDIALNRVVEGIKAKGYLL